MRFINPKTDLAFKKIFGSEESKPILLSFLNAILHAGEQIIVDLTIVDPYSIPRLDGMKDTYLDVRATLASGEHVLIEMQVLNIPGLEKRILYNAAKEYANQLQKGIDYDSLNPVIALTITDFEMFDYDSMKEQIISRFALVEKDKFIDYPNGDVELVFVELPKFTLEAEELATITEKWLYFLRSATDLQIVPDSLKAIPEIEQAFGIAEFAGLSQEEERALQKKATFIADQKSLREYARISQEKAAEAEEKAAKAEKEAASVKKEAAEKAAEAEEKAAEAEEKAAEAEGKAAEAEGKAARLAEKLREAGIDPDSV